MVKLTEKQRNSKAYINEMLAGATTQKERARAWGETSFRFLEEKKCNEGYERCYGLAIPEYSISLTYVMRIKQIARQDLLYNALVTATSGHWWQVSFPLHEGQAA